MSESKNNPNKPQQVIEAQNQVIKPEGSHHASNQNQHYNIKKQALGQNTKR